jgi:hypothetical protein
MFISILNVKASTLIDLNELVYPRYLTANERFLIVEDRSSIKMFSTKNFKPVKTFGRKGEGPGEFKDFGCPQIISDSIMVSSVRKVSFFDFSGNLVKESKTKHSSSYTRKIKDKYISESLHKEKDDFYISYDLLGPDFVKEKSFYKGKWSIHMSGKRDLFEIYFYDVHDNKIVFAHREGFKIGISDQNGNSIHTIKLEPRRIPFTDEDMKNIFTEMEADPKQKGFVQSLKKRSIKPDYFPAIRECRVANGKIYVITYLKEKEQSECYIFNMKGEQLKRKFIPLKVSSPLIKPLFTINDGRLYQLIENVEKEQWQLVISKIE